MIKLTQNYHLVTKQPMEYKRPARIPISLSPGSGEKLERYSRFVSKDRLATTAAFLLQQKLDELDAAGEIPEDDVVLSRQDFDQIVKFVKLLVGDRTKRNGISFVLLGSLLGIESGKLSELHSVLEKCRQEHEEHSQV